MPVRRNGLEKGAGKGSLQGDRRTINLQEKRTMFVAFTHAENYRGFKAVIQETGEAREFEGVKLVQPVDNGAPRILQPFERCFETRQEAADWAAGEIEDYARRLLEQAAALRSSAVSAEGVCCV